MIAQLDLTLCKGLLFEVMTRCCHGNPISYFFISMPVSVKRRLQTGGKMQTEVIYNLSVEKAQTH